MAEKKEEAKPAEGAEAPAKSGIAKLAVLAAAVVIVPLAAAVGVYMFVLAPRLQPAEPAAEHGAAHGDDSHGDESGGDAHGGHDDMGHAAAVEFDDESVNVLPSEEGGKPALLTYKCAIVVNNHDLELAVGDKAKKPFFSSILLKLHSNRTKTELNDPRVKESILRQAKQEANAMVKKLFPDMADAKVLDVLHIKYTIFEI